MAETSPDSPLLASTSTSPPKGAPGLNASLSLDPSPSSPTAETENYLAVDDSDNDDDNDNNNNNNELTKRFGISTSMVMLTRLILFGLTLADIITWAVAGELSGNRFVVLMFIELVFMLITNGCFIFKLVRENRPLDRSRGRVRNCSFPRISLAVGDWFCVLGAKEFVGFGGKDKETRRMRSLLGRLFGVFIELYFGITLIVFTNCAFDTAWWYYLSQWKAPLIIGYVVGSFQLLAVILNQIKPLGRRTTIEVAYHGVGPVQKDRYIQLPVDAETAIPPMSIAA
ncbi:hypothetical protein N0V85_000240 [Neurospora sp. IMI 360204]|nr:hypothetical protein N0V85_000240 [Neurospora sp. IMI 360204]